jgi:hypothetical protein
MVEDRYRRAALGQFVRDRGADQTAADDRDRIGQQFV